MNIGTKMSSQNYLRIWRLCWKSVHRIKEGEICFFLGTIESKNIWFMKVPVQIKTLIWGWYNMLLGIEVQKHTALLNLQKHRNHVLVL
jgi:hypothetical protein